MPILNYTTGVSIERSVAEIQSKLAKARASAVMAEYDAAGIPIAISFRIETAHGLLTFRLPANVAGVFEAIAKDRAVDRRLKTRDQARRVAWRIVKDWLEVQLAVVESGLAEMAEVFLPYAQGADGHTVYDRLKSGGFAALTHSPRSE